MMEKITRLFLVLAALAMAVGAGNVETNYMSQMEEGTLMRFWRHDMDYVADYLQNEVLPTYEVEDSYFTKCKIHKLSFKKFALHTDNVKVVMDPAKLQVNFSQNVGFDFEAQLMWEYNLLYFPISGTATFRGQAIDLIYSLNLTQPFVGNLFVPNLHFRWNFTEWSVDSALGSLFGIPTLVNRMFVEAMNGVVLDTLTTDMQEDISLYYMNYYKPIPDTVSFAGLNTTIDVMRRYKRIYIDVHLLAVVYQESVDWVSAQAETDQIEVIRNQVQNDGYEGSGMLRRYLRDFRVFEQVAKKLLGLISGFAIRSADLPPTQKTKLDADSMERLVPGFKAKYATSKDASLAITGLPDLANPELEPVDPSNVRMNNVGLRFEYYAKDGSGKEEQFLNVTLKAAIDMKPYNVWDNDTLILNFAVTGVAAEIVEAKSKVFKEINLGALKSWVQTGMLEFLSGKCGKNMMGDGLGIRDELGALGNVSWALDVAGKTFNTWLYQVKP